MEYIGSDIEVERCYLEADGPNNLLWIYLKYNSRYEL